MKIRPLLRTLSQHTLRFLLPWACAGCRTALGGLDDEGFCAGCWLRLPRIQGCVCGPCGMPLRDGGNLCFTCRQEPLTIVVRAAATFQAPLAAAIHRFKYAGRKTLAEPFGLLLDYAWRLYPELQAADALVPVPLHPANLRDRGYNQAALLGQVLARHIGKPLLGEALRRCRRTRPQFDLHRKQRQVNLAGAFESERDVSCLLGRHLLLIDDVCTTGATLRECATALRKAGAASVKALVLARDL